MMNRFLSYCAVLASLLAVQSTVASAQSTAYVRLSDTECELASYKKYTPRHKNVKNPWYAGDETLQYTPSADGGGTVFIWDGGLRINYDYTTVNTTAWDVEGNRTRPTGSTTITFTSTGLTIKTYNDVQLYTTFDEDTGREKVPDDPYREAMECRGGTAQRRLVFAIGRTKYEGTASVTCSHTHKVLAVQRGGWNRNHTTYMGGAGSGSAGNFISPQKFTHTQTISLSFAAMAKIAEMTEAEMFRRILYDGLTGFVCTRYKSDTEYSFLNLLFYKMAAKKCGVTTAQLREEYMKLPPQDLLASLKHRDENLHKYDYNLADPEIKDIYLPEAKAIMDDYTDLMRRLIDTDSENTIIKQARTGRLAAMNTYYNLLRTVSGQNVASQQFEAAKQSEPDPMLANVTMNDLVQLIRTNEQSMNAQGNFDHLLQLWHKPLVVWKGTRQNAKRQLDVFFDQWNLNAWNGLQDEDELFNTFAVLRDSLLRMYDTAVRYRLAGNEHYTHWKDNDAQTASHLLEAANNYSSCVEKLFQVIYYTYKVFPFVPTGNSYDNINQDFAKAYLMPLDTIAKAKDMLVYASRFFVYSLYRLHYVANGKYDDLLDNYFSLTHVYVDLDEVKRKKEMSRRDGGPNTVYPPDYSFPVPSANEKLRPFYEFMVCVDGLVDRTPEETETFYFEQIGGVVADIDTQYGNTAIAKARKEMLADWSRGEHMKSFHSKVLYSLALHAMTDGDYDRVWQLADELTSQRGDYKYQPDALELKGMVYVKRGNMKAAKDLLKKILLKKYPEIDWKERPLYKALKEAGEVK